MTPNEKAFLDTIAYSEVGPELLAASDNGYNVLVGSTASHPLFFDSYVDHPNVYNKTFNSTAAGRYQIIYKYWVGYKKMLELPDFGPDSQDQVAMQYLKECHALDDINAGNFASAIAKTAHIWASFPGAGYGQHENDIGDLQVAFTTAGGTLATA